MNLDLEKNLKLLDQIDITDVLFITIMRLIANLEMLLRILSFAAAFERKEIPLLVFERNSEVELNSSHASSHYTREL